GWQGPAGGERGPGGNDRSPGGVERNPGEGEEVSMPQLSKKIQELKASSTMAFNARAKEMARQGVDVIDMTAGEPDFQPPEHVLAAAREAIELGLTKYTPTEGTPE